MKKVFSLILYIIAENERAILKTVVAPVTSLPSPSTPGNVRAGIHGWHTFAAEWHVREPFAGVLEGRQESSLRREPRLDGGGKSPRVNTRNHGDWAGVLVRFYLRPWHIAVVRQTIRRETTSRPSKRVALLPQNSLLKTYTRLNFLRVDFSKSIDWLHMKFCKIPKNFLFP